MVIFQCVVYTAELKGVSYLHPIFEFEFEFEFRGQTVKHYQCSKGKEPRGQTAQHNQYFNSKFRGQRFIGQK